MNEEELERLYMDIYDNGIFDYGYKEKFKRYINNRLGNLEKENAELKLKLEALEGQTPWKDIKDKSEVIGKLTKAKELIKKLCEAIHKWDYKNFEEVEKEAEQFLDGESTTSNECHNCAKFDEMPKGPRCKTCDNGSRFQKKEEA